MARPNVLTFKAIPSGGMLQMISNNEFNSIANRVLEKFAASDGAGDLFLSAGANGNYTSIGTHTDNRTENVGSTDISITSNTVTFYQDLFANNIGSVTHKPLTWDYTSESIRIFTSSELNAFADDIINHMVINEAAGSYRLANSSPAAAYGGTWTSIATLLNQVDKDNSAAAFLYKKLTDSSALECRPLRYTSGNSLQLMTDGQISELANAVRSRIVENNIGKYLLQTTAPTPGTWVNVGTITDTRRTTTASGPGYTGPATYTGPAVGYTGPAAYSSAASYTGPAQFAGPAQFTGPAAVQFTGTTGVQFAGTTAVQFTGTAQFAGQANFTGNVLNVFYGGPDAVQFAGAAAAQFAGEANFIGPGGQFTGPASYSGPATFTGTAGYVGPASYVSETPFFQPGQAFTGGGSYTGPATFAGFAQFAGPGGTFYGPANYTGTDPDGAPFVVGVFPNLQVYMGPGGPVQNFSGTAAFTGPAQQFSGPAQFYGTSTFSSTANYIGATVIYYGSQSFIGTATFYGPVGFYGFFPWAGTAQFAGGAVNYTGPAQFAGIIATTYAGPGGYSRFVPVNYAGPAQFSGPAQFTGFVPAQFTSYVPAQFTGFVPAQFAGTALFAGQANFTGGASFTGTAQFSGTTFAGEASYVSGPANVVGSALVTLGQTTLWRRIG